MSCEKLYLTAPEMLECTARVVSCTPNKNDGYDLETDRTPFFPEGGGQLSDIGTVYDPMQGFVPVTYCFEANGTVLHRTGKPFAVGEIVTLKVDAAKRLKYTQQHTGEHLLSHAYDVLFGAENVGFHMAGDVVTIDLDHDLSDEEIEAGEKYANELVWKNAPVRIFNVDASELPNLLLRKKNEKLHGEVRIVEVEDGDHTEMCTCCGTHFMSTAPVGLIKVLEHARYKSGCRITFACGVLALEHFTKENAELRRTAAALSVKPDGVFDALARKEEQVQGLNQKLREKTRSLQNCTAKSCMPKHRRISLRHTCRSILTHAKRLPKHFARTIISLLCCSAMKVTVCAIFARAAKTARSTAAPPHRKSTLCSAQKAVAAP